MSAADDAAWAASLLAVAGDSLGGVCLRSGVQPARTLWLEMLRELLPAAAPLRRIPFNIADGRLLGGLDLTATLAANRPVAERGVLAATDGGVVVVSMAERMSAHTAACLAAVLDTGELHAQRDGVDINDAARVAIVALDESRDDEEGVPITLLDRLAFLVDLNGFDLRTPLLPLHEAEQIDSARALFAQVEADDEIITALCSTALALGAGSVRVSRLSLTAAKAVAALAGRRQVTSDDAVLAARLVFAPRATRAPTPQAADPPAADPPDETQPAEPPAPQEPPATQPPSSSSPSPEAAAAAESQDDDPQELEERVQAATAAAIPAGLLASLTAGVVARGPAAPSGRAGALRGGGTRGRPAGTRSGPPRGRTKLNVMETLRAAAPWQRLRGRLSATDQRVRIAAADFRVTHYQQRSQTLTIFAVDASGSSALNRLAEAKGAVELLLADCYVRRDQVAVITFRGRKAELLLPPTRSLVRAKRNLAGMPGGGGTPLASAIDTAAGVAMQALRRGETPMLVLLCDGRANVARNGTGGRAAAHADSLDAAQRLRRARISALFIDTSPRPSAAGAEIAAAMNADYVPLPFANARALSSVVAAAAVRAAQ